jgi:hypothetical protein
VETQSPAALWVRDQERKRQEQKMLEWEMYANMLRHLYRLQYYADEQMIPVYAYLSDQSFSE